MKKGDIVKIKNKTLGGKLINEGKARLLKKHYSDEGLEYWEVKFLDDGQITDRWVENENKIW